MPTVNFFIRTKAKNRLSSIRCRIRDGVNYDAYAHTGYKILSNHWSQSKQTAKNIADFPEKDELNKNLRSLRNFIIDQFSETISEKSTGWLQQTIDLFHNPTAADVNPDLFSFIEDFIAKAAVRPSPKTGKPVSYKMRREYERTLHYLKEFSTKRKRQIDFKDITLDFYHDFIIFLQSEKTVLLKDGKKKKEPGLALNTIGKKIQTLKIFLNAATDEGLNASQHYKSHRFTVLKEESDHVHLDENEIERIYKLDLSNNARLEKVRDLFIVGCWTGLRFSDWNQVLLSNIEETPDGDKLLKVRQSKTGGEIYIPFHPMAADILDKYSGVLPRVPSNQKCNQYLKEVMQIAEINSQFQKTITKGGVTRTINYKKWEVVGTHTARRSFATNLYNAGVPSLTIMQITGHKTESAFLKYIKVTPKEHAVKLARIWGEKSKTIIRQIS